VIARHIEQRDVQQGDEVFEVGIGQVAASDEQFDAAEVTVTGKAIEAFDNFVADCKNLHGEGILP
jgi:hypothetical protein